MATNRTVVNDLIYRRDCGILFDPRSNTVFKLDEIADEIVSGMADGNSATAVAELMAKKYDIEPQTVLQDIMDFWDSISETGDSSDTFEEEKDIQNTPAFPFNLEMVLTKACDLKCSFCHDSVMPSFRSHAHMPVETVKSLLNLYTDSGLLRIRYSGGEPMLHPHFFEILTHGKELGLYQVVFTNGQCVTEEISASWREMNVGEVLISLHGSEATHDVLTRKDGSYKRAIGAIRSTLSSGIGVVVEMTMVQQNLGEVFDTIATVRDLGVKQFRLMRYVGRGKDDDVFSIPLADLSPLIDEIEQRYGEDGISIRFPCSQKFCLTEEGNPHDPNLNRQIRDKYLIQNCFAGLNWGSISHSGELRICPHSSKSLANLFEDPYALIELWPTVIRQQVLEILSQRDRKCSDCKAWNKCLGGCYLSSL